MVNFLWKAAVYHCGGWAQEACHAAFFLLEAASGTVSLPCSATDEKAVIGQERKIRVRPVNLIHLPDKRSVDLISRRALAPGSTSPNRQKIGG